MLVSEEIKNQKENAMFLSWFVYTMYTRKGDCVTNEIEGVIVFVYSCRLEKNFNHHTGTTFSY